MYIRSGRALEDVGIQPGADVSLVGRKLYAETRELQGRSQENGN